MKYALIDVEGIITNIIVMSPDATDVFPDAVQIEDHIPVGIGDRYLNGKFYRDEQEISNIIRDLNMEILYREQSIAELDAALLDATYENIIGGLE